MCYLGPLVRPFYYDPFEHAVTVAVKSPSVLVFLPLKQTGPMPKNGFTADVVVRAHPLQSIACVMVCPAATIEHPKGSRLVMVCVHGALAPRLVLSSAVHEVLNVVEGAQDVTVAVASTVRVDRHALNVVSCARERVYKVGVFHLLSHT